MKKKILVAFLALALLIVPVKGISDWSHAEEVPVWDGSVDISWYTECENPEEQTDFYIDTPEKLAGLAYIVNGRLDTEMYPTVMKENDEGKGSFNKTTDLEDYTLGRHGTNTTKPYYIMDDFYVIDDYGHGAYDYDKDSKSYVANSSGTGTYDKGTGIARFSQPTTGDGYWTYDETSNMFVPASTNDTTYNIEILTEYKFDRLDADGNHNGSYDIDVEATVENVVDGSESDGVTASGLTAEDFFVAEPTHIVSSGGFGSADDYYYIGYQKYDFMGKTIHITSDMDLGGRYYSFSDGSVKWYGNEWTPIGGDFLEDVTSTPDQQDAADLVAVESNFNGSLDGGYHTISNMYLKRWAGGNFMLCQGLGLVGLLGEKYDSESSEYGHADQAETVPDGWVPTVSNLAVASGYVYSNRMVGGVVGRTGDVDNGVLIENCSNGATLKTTDAKGVGGICGTASGDGTIRNCYNTGNITATYSSCPAGGIVGSNELNIYNCYNTGQISNTANVEFSEGIGSHYEGEYVIDNCYSLQGSYEDQRYESTSNPGYYLGSAQSVVCNTYSRSSYDTTDEKGNAVNGMKSSGFVDELNGNGGSAFVADSTLNQKNNGYPILFWQADGFDKEQTATVQIVDQDKNLGTISATVPSVKSGSTYTESRTITAEDGAVTVPVGTVLSLSQNAETPNVLENYTAIVGDAEQVDIRGNYYTVTAADTRITLGGTFVTLNSGRLTIASNSKCQIGVSKNGIALDKNGKAWSVTDYTVSDGDTVFQRDIITEKAVLKKGAEPSDRTQEYTGKIEYTYTYPTGTVPDSLLAPGKNSLTNRTGIVTVASAIGDGSESDNNTLKISVSPLTQEKQWTTVADTSWCDSNDLKKEYTISTAEELAGLAKLVNDGESFEGVTIRLGDNINLKNSDGTGATRKWIAIGNSTSNTFNGTFDGNGHTIKSLNAVTSLFGFCKNATINNLNVRGNAVRAGIVGTMTGGNIESCVSHVTVSGSSAVGGIAGTLTSEGEITGCRNKGIVTAGTNVGGIVGNTTATAGKIMMCANYGAVTASSKGTTSYTGGIVGNLMTEVRGCANYGPITSANGYVGGIAGYTSANEKEQGAASAIYDSYNWADVEATYSNSKVCAGGLVGYAYYILMDNCYSTGNVTLAYTGTKPHMGSLIGYFYKSAYNNIDNTYYNAEGNTIIVKDLKTTGADEGKDISELTEPLSYVTVAKKTSDEMQSDDFVTLLNGKAVVAFAKTTASYPQSQWITKLEEYTVTYTGDYTGTDKAYYNGSVDLPECAEDGYMYSFQEEGSSDEWTGLNITENVTVHVTKTAVTRANVIFRAEGKTVSTIDFSSDQKYLTQAAPDVTSVAPVKTGYTATWDEDDLVDSNGISYWDSSRTNYLGTSNIVINAVYSQNTLPFTKNDDGEGHINFTAQISKQTVNADKYYFLAPRAKGTITVKEGTEVTLDGSNGPFTNVRIVVEAGADVTLKDMDLTTDPAYMAGSDQGYGVLDVTGGDSKADATVIRTSGTTSIYGSNDGSSGTKNFFSPLVLAGYVVFDQSGSKYDTMHLSSNQGCPEITIKDGATLEVAGGILEVFKTEKLGGKGGIIYGQCFDYGTKSGTGLDQFGNKQQGNLTVSGGVLASVSDTNNVFAMCVNKYTQTGGQALFYATEAGDPETGQGDNGTDAAIYASEYDITGGSLYAGVRTHQSDSEDPIYYYNCKDAIRTGSDDADFSNQYFLYAVDTSSWDSDKTVTVDGKIYYTGEGNTVSYKIGDGDAFGSKKSQADPYLYLWLKKGEKHTVAVDGIVIAENVGGTNAAGTIYTASKDGNELTVRFHEKSFAADPITNSENGTDRTGKTVNVLLYDASGNLLGSLQDYTFLKTEESSAVSMESDLVSQAVSCRIFLFDGPDTLRPIARSGDVTLY